MVKYKLFYTILSQHGKLFVPNNETSLFWVGCADAATGDVLHKTCSEKFRYIHRETPVLEFLFNKVVDVQACNFIKNRLQHRYFPVNIAQFLRTTFLKNTWVRLLLIMAIWLCFSRKSAKLAILSKSKNNILRSIQVFSGDLLLSFLLSLYLLLAQFRALIDVL